MTEEEIERIAQCEAHRAHSDAYATHEAHLMHKAHGEAHVCPHCGRSFPTQQGLAAHLRFCRRRGEDTPSPGEEGAEEAHTWEEETLEHAEHEEELEYPFERVRSPRELLSEVLSQAERWGLKPQARRFIIDQAEEGISPSELYTLLNRLSQSFTGLPKELTPYLVRRFEKAVEEERRKAMELGEPYYYPSSTPLERSDWWRSPSPQPYSQTWNPSPSPSGWRGSASPPYSPPPSRYAHGGEDPFLRHLQNEVEEYKSKLQTLEEELRRTEYENLEARLDMLEKRVEEKLNNAVELKKVEIQRDGLEMFRDMQRSLSRKLDKIIDLLISLGKGEKIVKVRNEIPEYEEVEGEEDFEDYLPPEFVEEG